MLFAILRKRVAKVKDWRDKCYQKTEENYNKNVPR